MNLTIEQLIARAARMLQTGQPGMAVLYMRKALELIAAAQTKTPLQVLKDGLGAAFDHVATAFSSLIDAVASAFSDVGVMTQFDFALAADS